MKKIKIKKLTLNKEKVSELSQQIMDNAKGGRKTYAPTECEVEISDFIDCTVTGVSCIVTWC